MKVKIEKNNKKSLNKERCEPSQSRSIDIKSKLADSKTTRDLDTYVAALITEESNQLESHYNTYGIEAYLQKSSK